MEYKNTNGECLVNYLQDVLIHSNQCSLFATELIDDRDSRD